MTSIDHEKWAKVILRFLVDRIKNYEGGDKYITYANLARKINYDFSELYNTTNFGRTIGMTLGVLGHMIEDQIIDGFTPPLIQAMVVGQNSKLPSTLSKLNLRIKTF